MTEYNVLHFYANLPSCLFIAKHVPCKLLRYQQRQLFYKFLPAYHFRT